MTLIGAHGWRTAWSRLGWPPAERWLGKFDVLHFTDWMYPPQRAGLRATTIHDLVPLHFPQWVTGRTRLMHGRKYRNAARTCDVMFANSAFTADGSLRPEYLVRLEKVLDKADELRMVVILGLFYFGQDERLKDEAAIQRGVDNAVDWLFQKGYRNIPLVDPQGKSAGMIAARDMTGSSPDIDP